MPITIDFHGLTAAPLAPNVSSATARLDAFSLRANRVQAN